MATKERKFEVTISNLNKKAPIVIVNYDDGQQLRLDPWGQRAYNKEGHLLFKKQHDHLSRFLYKSTIRTEENKQRKKNGNREKQHV